MEYDAFSTITTIWMMIVLSAAIAVAVVIILELKKGK